MIPEKAQENPSTTPISADRGRYQARRSQKLGLARQTISYAGIAQRFPKQRSLRYIAGADREWLYPERHLPSTHWRNFGKGLLLMPEPREIHMGGEVMVSYKGGGVSAWNEYGLRPWQEGYEDDKRSAEESKALSRFQAEWAAMQGPEYRGTSCEFHSEQEGPYVTPDEFHRHDLERARRYRRRG